MTREECSATILLGFARGRLWRPKWDRHFCLSCTGLKACTYLMNNLAPSEVTCVRFGRDWTETYVALGLHLNYQLVRRRDLELEDGVLDAGEAAMKHSGAGGYYPAGQLAVASHDPVQSLFALAIIRTES